MTAQNFRSPSSPLLKIAIPLLVVGLSGCQGEVTEDDLQLWSNNSVGLERIQEVLNDQEVPLDTRVRAMEVVVEKQFASSIVSMIDNIRFEQEAVVDGLKGRLLAHIEARDEAQLDAKDALMMMQRFFSADELDGVRQKIAAWAFRDVTWEAAEETVKKAVSTRLSLGQIADLGKYGWEAAAILVSHGFTNKMLDVLSASDDPEASRLLIKGLTALHESDHIHRHHIDAIAKLKTATAAVYLFDLYFNKGLDEDTRNLAFNAAVDMLGSAAIRKSPGSLPDRLLALMKTGSPEDRWIGAVNLVRISGADHLDELLKRFVDDGSYGDAEEDPKKSVIDLCLDLFDQGHAEAAKGTFMSHVNGTNRVLRAISMVCLKCNEAFMAQSVLKTRVNSPETNIVDLFGPGFTIGSLASNTSEGLSMIEAVAADLAAGRINQVEYENKVLIIKFELKASGVEYNTLVEMEYAEWHKEYEADPARFPAQGK